MMTRETSDSQPDAVDVQNGEHRVVARTPREVAPIPVSVARLRSVLARREAACRRVRNALAALPAEYAATLAGELGVLEALETEFADALSAQGEACTPTAEMPHAGEAALSEESVPQSQMLQSRKLEAIGQLTGGVAHCFNNVLTVVTSGLQLLSRTTDEERRRRLTRGIEEAAWRGADLTHGLLAFARRQPLTPQQLDVARHMEGLRELLRHGLRDDTRILTRLPDGLWPVEADVAALESAILNLAVNARNAMPSGGTMVLGARNISRDEPFLTRLGLRPGDYIELFVTDTGAGMTPEVLSRVFEPFFTTKPSGQGTGLAEVYGFAKQSGGIARAESQPGQGATVAILLPRPLRPAAAAPASHTARQEVRPRAPARTRLAVLVVEDDNAVASTILEMLGQLGHRGLRVSSLPAAIAVLAGSDRIDVIVSDVPLGGGGLALAQEVARRNLDIPMVLSSGYGGGVTVRLAAAQLPFLPKPCTLEGLREALGSALESEHADVVELAPAISQWLPSGC